MSAATEVARDQVVNTKGPVRGAVRGRRAADLDPRVTIIAEALADAKPQSETAHAARAQVAQLGAVLAGAESTLARWDALPSPSADPAVQADAIDSVVRAAVRFLYRLGGLEDAVGDVVVATSGLEQRDVRARADVEREPLAASSRCLDPVAFRRAAGVRGVVDVPAELVHVDSVGQDPLVRPVSERDRHDSPSAGAGCGTPSVGAACSGAAGAAPGHEPWLAAFYEDATTDPRVARIAAEADYRVANLPRTALEFLAALDREDGAQ